MNCPFCSTENPDGAAFCKHCGMPMSGLVDCPVCGAKTPADGEFCVSCGARIQNNKIPAPVINSISDKNQQNTATPSCSVSHSHVIEVNYRSFSFLGESIAFFTAFFALVFSFFIGYKITPQDSFGTNGQTVYIYYYLSDIFSDLNSALLSINSHAFIGSASYYTRTIIGVFVAVCAILCTLALFIVASTRYTMLLYRNSSKRSITYSIFTILSFILSSVLFLQVHTFRISALETESTELLSAEYYSSLNGATIAGIVLCVVGLVTAIIFSISGYALKKQPQNKSHHYMIYIITAILSIICIVFIGSRIFSANVTLLYETIDSKISYNFNVGFLSGLIILGKLDIDTEGALCEKYSYATNPIRNLAIGGATVQFFATVCAFILLALLLSNLAEGKAQSGRILLAAVFLSTCIIFCSAFSFTIENYIPAFVKMYFNDVYPSIDLYPSLETETSVSLFRMIIVDVVCTIMIVLLIIYALLPDKNQDISQ